MARRKSAQPRDADQIRRDAARLHALKGQAMRDLRAVTEATARIAAKKRAAPAAAPAKLGGSGIRMGSR